MDTTPSPVQTLDSLASPESSSLPSPRPRCEPDPLDPESNICLAKVTTDDRQGISHFFGRNKKATASIPESMFPLLCRTHYQEKQYRWKEDSTAFAAFQCDCILKTLERMAKKTFIDADGVEWPYWCGFEVQIQRPSASAKDEESIPDWLQSVCQANASTPSFSAIGDRNGVQYNFTQLELLVKSIKTWCLEKEVKLPAIEALPVTIGMVDEADLEAAKKALKDATREHTLASAEYQKYRQSRRETTNTKRQQLQTVLQEKVQALTQAQTAVAIAQADSDATKSTLPTKRVTKKARAAKRDSSVGVTPDIKTDPTTSPEIELDELESPNAGQRRTRIILKYKGVKRGKLGEEQ